MAGCPSVLRLGPPRGGGPGRHRLDGRGARAAACAGSWGRWPATPGGPAGAGGRPLPEGDAELPAGPVRLLRFGRHSADEQRPGAVLRLLPLSRASGHVAASPRRGRCPRVGADRRLGGDADGPGRRGRPRAGRPRRLAIAPRRGWRAGSGAGRSADDSGAIRRAIYARPEFAVIKPALPPQFFLTLPEPLAFKFIAMFAPRSGRGHDHAVDNQGGGMSATSQSTRSFGWPGRRKGVPAMDAEPICCPILPRARSAKPPAPAPRRMVKAELLGLHSHRTVCGAAIHVYSRDGRFLHAAVTRARPSASRSAATPCGPRRD